MLFDISDLSPMSLGRVRKHLEQLVRYKEEVMMNQEMYEAFPSIAKRHKVTTEEVDILSYGLSTGRKELRTTHFYDLVSGDGQLLELPKMLYEICTLPEETT